MVMMLLFVQIATNRLHICEKVRYAWLYSLVLSPLCDDSVAKDNVFAILHNQVKNSLSRNA